PTIAHFDSTALTRHRVKTVVGNGKASRALVGVGRVASQRVVIVEPATRRACAPDEVGEIWVADPSVTRGYWNREAETALAFNGHLADGDGPFLRTGDLGFIHGGELFVAGRLKELIIVRGRNHHPVDIEETSANSHAALSADGVAAFALERDGEEGLVIVHEIKRGERVTDFAAVASAIRRAVAGEHEIDPSAIVLTAPLAVPKPSSGKTERRTCRDEYLAGALPIRYEWRRDAVKAVAAKNLGEASFGRATAPSANEIEAWLLTRL